MGENSKPVKNRSDELTVWVASDSAAVAYLYCNYHMVYAVKRIYAYAEG
jgi:hypothetical protein